MKRGEFCKENKAIQLSNPSSSELKPLQLTADHRNIPSLLSLPHIHLSIHLFIHFISLHQCFKPTNYHQLPPDGLYPCSCFSCPFRRPCINKPVVTNKKGGEWWLFKAHLRESEKKPTFHTQGGLKAPPVFYGLVQETRMRTNWKNHKGGGNCTSPELKKTRKPESLPY